MSAKLGLIVRADEGGLGTQTWEYARHLRPDAVLFVALDEPRGEYLEERYDFLAGSATRFFSHVPVRGEERSEWGAFADFCDVVFTAETGYFPAFVEMCAARGTRLVVHANPELWEYGPRSSVEAWAPTAWMRERLPLGTPVVPVGVDRERCAPRAVESARHILHVSAPAMKDRNGTQLLRAAVPLCQEPFELLVAGPEGPAEGVRLGKVWVRGRPRKRDYWRIYDEADALVLPRRYGGLSLPMQEAASCGLPIVSLALDPQRRWLHPALAVQATGGRACPMKGGSFLVWKCSPEQLAGALDRLVLADRTGELPAMCAAGERWARELDWHHLVAEYDQRLGRVSAEEGMAW